MQFNIDQDIGTAISAWVAPDNPDVVPQIVLSGSDREDIVLAANRTRADIRELGLHSTGMVGFWIDDAIVPDIQSWIDLSIREAQGRVLIHRRHNGLPVKLFLLDASMTAPASLSLTGELDRLFTLPYDAVERYPFDTLFAILNNQTERSISAYGRLPLTRYLNILRANGFVCGALLKHPFEELGCRLEIAHQAAWGTVPDAIRHSVGLEPLVDLMKTTNLGDVTGLHAAMQTLTASQAAAIANPMVKLLACSADEPPHRAHVAVALENLAALDLVGSYAQFDSFRMSLSEILNRPIFETYRPEASFAAKQIAGVLARMEPIRKLLALDLALHSYIEDAFSIAEAELQRRSAGSDRPVL
jgi:hypothetical protein